jgi:DNA-directed RNA polymerase subunit RPC12/RpoP
MTDRKELIEVLEHCIKDGCSGCPNHYSDGNAACDDYTHGRIACIPVVMGQNAISLLKEQPEQKHGHWIEQDDYNDTYYKCSVCGEPWVLIDGTPLENGMHFCPKCGARMESEVKQDEN